MRIATKNLILSLLIFSLCWSSADPVSVSELYNSGVTKMITAARSDDARAMEEAVSEIDVAAFEEHAHAS